MYVRVPQIDYDTHRYDIFMNGTHTFILQNDECKMQYTHATGTAATFYTYILREHVPRVCAFNSLWYTLFVDTNASSIISCILSICAINSIDFTDSTEKILH